MVNLDELKAKYRPFFEVAQKRGVNVTNAHIENNKLLIRAKAPNDQIKNELWNAIKAVDPQYADLTCDVSIDPTLKVPEVFYTVAAGDTLGKIAKHVYGESKHYMKIFEANKDQLSDPDKIKVGQKLRIPD